MATDAVVKVVTTDSAVSAVAADNAVTAMFTLGQFHVVDITFRD